MGKTILIIEQSEVVRKGLIKVIGSFNLFTGIHELACNASIEPSVIRLEPDILVINPILLKPGLTEWLRENRNNRMRIAAIVYTLFDDELKSLFDEIIQIGDTRLKIKTKLESIINKPAAPGPQAHDETLSKREKDVLKLLARGMSNKEISEQLFISPHTVITHRKNITRKLNIKSIAGLIVYGLINEIISIEEIQQD